MKIQLNNSALNQKPYCAQFAKLAEHQISEKEAELLSGSVSLSLFPDNSLLRHYSKWY